jgi:cell shape-determining protein MreC
LKEELVKPNWQPSEVQALMDALQSSVDTLVEKVKETRKQTEEEQKLKAIEEAHMQMEAMASVV